MLKRIANKLNQYKNSYHDKNVKRELGKISKSDQYADYSKTIVISGFYRGGTTWLMEFLAQREGYSALWEPLNKDICPEQTALGLDWKIYLDENQDYPEVKNYFENLLKGRILSAGLVAHTSIEQLKNSKSLVLKFCRLNASLPWFVRHFDTLPPIFLLRHPCAVVASQLSHPAWRSIGNSFPPLEKQYTDYFNQYGSILKDLKTKEEVLAADWCLDHMVALNHPENNKKWLTIFYEHLLTNRVQEVQRVKKRLEIDISGEQISALEKPSDTVRDGSYRSDPTKQISAWREKLDNGQIDRILSVLNKFNISCYSDDLYPISNG